MTMEWIDVHDRVPGDRRLVLVWTIKHMPVGQRGAFAMTKYNRNRDGSGQFDIERDGWLIAYTVTHWMDVEPPQTTQPNPPPRKL